MSNKDYYGRMWAIMMLMFVVSLVALFVIDKEYQWWAIGHLVLSFLGLIATMIAEICNRENN